MNNMTEKHIEPISRTIAVDDKHVTFAVDIEETIKKTS